MLPVISFISAAVFLIALIIDSLKFHKQKNCKANTQSFCLVEFTTHCSQAKKNYLGQIYPLCSVGMTVC